MAEKKKAPVKKAPVKKAEKKISVIRNGYTKEIDKKYLQDFLGAGWLKK